MMIRLEELTKKFGRFTAVDGISFEVRPGEIFGFLGANGAGKTTTIRMMCGLLKPSGGEIFIEEKPVSRSPEKIKRRIGYMSQKFSLYSDLSIGENVEFFGAVYGVSPGKIREKREKLAQEIAGGTPGIKAGDLPLGFKQRLGLACALLHEPPILFLDEPTSGVDPVGRREFWEKIYDLSSAGRTILVTTHFMDEAEYCDRIAIMSAGRLIELDTPERIRKKYNAETLNNAFIRAVEQDRTRGK